jgi:hypothetical protein
MHPERPWCTPGLRVYQTLMEKHRRSRLDNQRRLREFAVAHPEVELCCSHDPVEFERIAGRPQARPAAARDRAASEPAARRGELRVGA